MTCHGLEEQKFYDNSGSSQTSKKKEAYSISIKLTKLPFDEKEYVVIDLSNNESYHHFSSLISSNVDISDEYIRLEREYNSEKSSENFYLNRISKLVAFGSVRQSKLEYLNDSTLFKGICKKTKPI
jgi:hypothetical protein